MKAAIPLAALAALVLSSCVPYASFSLPPLQGRSGNVSWNWEVRAEPVLTRGAKGEWDAADALNPSVVHARGMLFNLYSGYDGRTWHTGAAVSNNGLAWQKRGRVLSPDPATWEGDYIASNGSAAEAGGKLHYWYQGGRVPQIGLATSEDGVRWVKRGAPVLEAGPWRSWDERGVADPYVIQIGPVFYMYYLGQDRARRQRLGLARSEDGVHWQKLRANPILDLGEPGTFDETGLGEPAVWQQHGWYWMLYTARDRKEFRRLGLARSSDGVHWKRVTEEPVLEGSQPWNKAVVCDPTVMVQGDAVHVWFGGGNRPEPAENLAGQIGFAILRLRIGD